MVNLLQRSVEIGLFFHPAVHWLSRSLRSERELCTDALAVRLTGNPLALAQALESVARLRLNHRSSAPMPIAGMSLGGQTASLLPRIQELIGMTPTRPRLQFWPLAALPLAAILALVVTVAGFAEDRPSAPADLPATAVPTKPTTDRGPSGHAAVRQGVQSDRLIVTYDVRNFDGLDANSWRNRLDDRLKLIQQEADVTVWVIDDNSLYDLLTFAQGDTRCNVLMAPKVSADEGARAIVVNRRKHHYISGFEKIQRPEGLAFKPIVKSLESGYRIEMTGSLLATGMRLAVDLRDSSYLMHGLSQKGRFRNGDVKVTYQVPTAIERRFRVSCDIPEGSSVVISLGLEERSGQLDGPAEVASGILQTVGFSKIKADPVISERLIVIKPRRVDSAAGGKTANPVSKIENRDSMIQLETTQNGRRVLGIMKAEDAQGSLIRFPE